MALLQLWRDMAYDESANKGDLQKFWADYFKKEQAVYKELLAEPDVEVKGSVSELAAKYNLDLMAMTGFWTESMILWLSQTPLRRWKRIRLSA